MRFLTSTFLLISFLVTVNAVSEEIAKEWLKWTRHHDKQYPTWQESVRRFRTWHDNWLIVNASNSQDLGYSLDLNAFADRTPDEMPRAGRHVVNMTSPEEVTRVGAAPAAFDWRTKTGCISPVRNQGQMGNAEIVAVLENAESLCCKFNGGRVISLSQQEIVDCCTTGGQVVPDVFNCLWMRGGLCSEAEYPATAKPRPCRAACGASSNTCKVYATQRVPRGDAEAMKAVVFNSTVIALIDAGTSAFQLYKSGIFEAPNCSQTRVDHAVQVVGYGSQNGTDFWILKNSWGAEWGMNGYMYMARGKNMCGVESFAFTAMVH